MKNINMWNIASRVEAITTRLEAISIGFEAIASWVEAIALLGCSTCHDLPHD